MRAVAAGADVDAALVHHYFGTKRELFVAAIRIPIDPMELIGPMRATPVDELGLKLASMVLTLWDSELGAGLIATLRTILAGAEVGLLRSFLREVVVAELGARVDDPPGTGIVRAEFVATQLVGVAMARYIVGLEPFASLPIEQIAETIAPTLQRYLTGELPGLPQREP